MSKGQDILTSSGKLELEKLASKVSVTSYNNRQPRLLSAGLIQVCKAVQTDRARGSSCQFSPSRFSLFYLRPRLFFLLNFTDHFCV